MILPRLRRLAWVATTILALSGIAQTVRADTGDVDTMDISISGTIVANGACTFNQGGTLQIDFGEVKLKPMGDNTVQLDGDYLKPLTTDFSCSGDSAGLLQMSFTSASGSYETFEGTEVLGADKGIVGIELLVNGTAQSMGTWFNVDSNNPPSLQAKLVQVSSTNSQNVVNGDVFTASGTLKLAFN